MADKISGAGGSTTDVSTATDTVDAPQKTDGAHKAQEMADAVNDFFREGIKDTWEAGESAQEEFAKFVGENSKDGSVESAVLETGKKTVLQMMADRAKAAASAEKAVRARGDGHQGLAEVHSAIYSDSNDVADMSQSELRGLINDTFGKNADMGKLDLAAHMSPKNRFDFANDISRTLMDRGDIPDDQIAQVRAKILEATEDVVLNAYEDQFIEHTKTVLSDAEGAIRDKFNADSSARREVLASFAEKSGDTDQIAKMMVGMLAVPKDDAEDIAAELAELHGHPDKIDALRAGAEGPETWGGLGDGEYTNLDQALESALDDAADNMESLRNRLVNDRVRGEQNDDHRLLADDTFKLGREMFMGRLASDGGVGEEAIAGLRAMAAEEAAEAEENLAMEGYAKDGVMLAAGIGVSLVTGGAAAPAVVGLATGTASSAPSMIGAWQDADLAAQAQAQGQTDAKTVEAARDARNKAIALTIAGTAAPSREFSKPHYRNLSEKAALAVYNGVAGEGFNRTMDVAYDAANALFD